MSKATAAVGNLAVIGMVLGYGGWILGSFLCYGWYCGWLDEHFFWRFAAYIIAMISFPLIPLAILIEWLWHGWPRELTLFFLMIVVGLFVGSGSKSAWNWAEERDWDEKHPDGRA